MLNLPHYKGLENEIQNIFQTLLEMIANVKKLSSPAGYYYQRLRKISITPMLGFTGEHVKCILFMSPTKLWIRQ